MFRADEFARHIAPDWVRWRSSRPGSWIWPLLGLLILPFTTLMWVTLWNPTTGISGFEWFWLFLAVLIDLGGAASSGYANRARYPGYGQPASRPSGPRP